MPSTRNYRVATNGFSPDISPRRRSTVGIAYRYLREDLRRTTVSEQSLTTQQRTALEAATFRRLIAHLDDRKDVQNIDLMILAGFCRNCLSKWYKASADEQGLSLDLDQARQRVYGMTYEEWKNNHQIEATAEQLAAMEKANG